MTDYRSFVAGGLAGVSVDFVLYPLDVWKTRKQSRVSDVSGKMNMRRGFFVNVLGSFTSSGIMWAVYEPLKRRFSAHSTLLGPAAAAACANVFVCLFRCPADVLKQRVQTGQFRNASAAIVAITSHGSVFSTLYGGFLPLLLRECVFDGMQFTLYERLRHMLGTEKDFTAAREVLPLGIDAAIGSVSGGATAFCTTPLDVVKTRIMTSRSAAGGVPHENSGMAVFRALLREGGPAALFKGASARTAMFAFGGAVYFQLYNVYRGILLPK